eukprot:1805315-Pleurochrysis_carterae.AAC.3
MPVSSKSSNLMFPSPRHCFLYCRYCDLPTLTPRPSFPPLRVCPRSRHGGASGPHAVDRLLDGFQRARVRLEQRVPVLHGKRILLTQ